MQKSIIHCVCFEEKKSLPLFAHSKISKYGRQNGNLRFWNDQDSHNKKHLLGFILTLKWLTHIVFDTLLNRQAFLRSNIHAYMKFKMATLENQCIQTCHSCHFFTGQNGSIIWLCLLNWNSSTHLSQYLIWFLAYG